MPAPLYREGLEGLVVGVGDWTGSLVALGTARRVEHLTASPMQQGTQEKDRAPCNRLQSKGQWHCQQPQPGLGPGPALCSGMPCDQTSCKI